ncbi:hypothetical protein A6767_01020 [Aeromonas veronii]|nr:hypothetical protein A6767_01020 [Aeromonas veronii]
MDITLQKQRIIRYDDFHLGQKDSTCLRMQPRLVISEPTMMVFRQPKLQLAHQMFSLMGCLQRELVIH